MRRGTIDYGLAVLRRKKETVDVKIKDCISVWIKRWRIQAIWETSIPVWAPKLWRPKSTFKVFFFQLYFNRYVEVAINDFTMHLIISKWLRRQKMQTEEKNNETIRGRNEKRNCLQKCSHSFEYVIDHANVRFFF